MKTVFFRPDQQTGRLAGYERHFALRIFVTEAEMGLAHPIWASLCPANLPYRDIFRFLECEDLWTQLGPFSYASPSTFSIYFIKFSIVYDHHCLQKFKMQIFWKIGDQRKILPSIS